MFYLTFLRAQRMYAEGLLHMNNPLISQDRKTISDLLNKRVLKQQMAEDDMTVGNIDKGACKDNNAHKLTSEEADRWSKIPQTVI